MFLRASIAVVILFFFISCEKDKSEIENIKKGGVHVGDVILHTQTEVNEFVSFAYDSINGDVIIDSEELVDPNLQSVVSEKPVERLPIQEVKREDPIIDISGVTSIKKINGDLIVRYNSTLESLSGLGEIEEVGGSVFIEDNKNLKDVIQFNELQSIGGVFYVSNNEKLLALNGFNKLRFIGSDFYVVDNGINEITGFNQLRAVKGTSLYISSNEWLVKIDGFNSLNKFDLESIHDLFKISISFNKELSIIKGFNALDTLQGYISIGFNDKIKSVEAFSNLKVISGIDGTINIYKCELLDDFSFLESVLNVTRLSLKNNASLTNLNFLNKDLEVVFLDVRNNLNLYDFCALNERIDTVSSINYLNFFGNGYNPYYNDFKEGNCSN